VKKILGAGLAAAMLLGACSGGGGLAGPDERDDRVVDLGGPGGVTLAALTAFAECDEFLSHVQTNALEMVGPWGLDGGPVYAMAERAAGGLAEDDLATDTTTPAAAPAVGDGAQAGVDFSTTNVQEIGVDEPDLVKTDGRRIVALAQGRLHVVDVTGDEPVLLGSLGMDEFWANDMFLVGDRVLLLSHADGGVLGANGQGRLAPGGYSQVSVLVEVDISDPSAPVLVHRLYLDGWYLSARMVDGVARIVVQSMPTGLVWEYPQGGGLRAERAALEANQEVVRTSTVENWLPYFVLEDGRGRVLDEGTLTDCSQAYHPADFSGLNMLNVVTVDLSDGLRAGTVDSTSVLADGQTVYASADSLYVGTTQWLDWRLVEESLDNDVELPAITTMVHKFDIADPARTHYRASGEVVGTVLNQYSMSEHDGFLRIATTDFDQWGRGDGSVSQVSVLEERDGELVVVGEVGDLGRGERIFAVRFLGDVATVVTFRQTDPLYTIDLGDPTDPRVVGELKILGYSAYLHPLDDDLLLGVGQDADEQGRTTGTQVSLFDIGDLADPTRVAQWTLPGGWTEAEFNARAFLHWAPEDLVVLPVNVQPWGPEGPQEPFFGAVAFEVAASTLVERARLTHSSGEQAEFCEQWVEIDERGEEVTHEQCWKEPDWQAAITRSVVVGDTLYTLSEKGLLASDLATLRPGTFVGF
jgi:hypothetical protein